MLTLGNGSKYGPIHISTNTKIPHDTTDANWVLPPTVCWIKDLDRDAVNGMHEKNDPTRLPAP